MKQEWVIRKKHSSKNTDDAQSIASSYMLTSCFSAASKRFNIDGILKEQEQILDRVQEIDSKLGERADIKEEKEKMIEEMIDTAIPLEGSPCEQNLDNSSENEYKQIPPISVETKIKK